MERKTFAAEVVTKAEGGGQIRISTAGVDRDRDRVMCRGVQAENYLRNPVVQWGHGYYEPWQTIGRTTALEVGESEIVASFELRPAANDQDPQNIVKLLWDGGWVKTASIGFQPLEWTDNEHGGKDITAWELLEWSLVPIPANQDALRLAAKGLSMGAEDEADAVTVVAVEADAKAAVVEDGEPQPMEEGDAAGMMPDGDADDDKGEAETESVAALNDAAAAEAAAELRLAAILADFISAVRPYLATGE